MIRRSSHLLIMWNQDLSAFTRNLRKANFIGGDFVAASGSQFIVESPSDAKSLVALGSSTPEDTLAAVEAAERAFPSWSSRTPHQRAAALRRLAALVNRHSRCLAELDALCGGLCLADGLASIASCVSCLELSASLAASSVSGYRLAPFTANTLDTGNGCNASGVASGAQQEVFYSEVRRCALGVCAFITPFNYPMEMGIWKIAPALAAGNTVVWKTALQTPLSAMRLAELCIEAELPRGVLNIIHGGAASGEALAASCGVQMIGFTGSVATGVAVQIAAAKSNLKRCQLELGGNAALIVDEGIDSARVARVAMSCFTHSGQSCTSTRRLLVPHGSLPGVISSLVDHIKRRKVGHALDPDAEQGPMISAAARHRVVTSVNEAVRLGQARLICGGFCANAFPGGYFMANTLLLCEDTASPIVREELFGPVLCITPYATLDQAIDMANSTAFGLSSNLLSNNPEVIHRVTSAVQAGTVWVNCADAMNATTPFGGVKRSGYGKDLGLLGLEGYSVMKTVTQRFLEQV
jgi:acyl-CoA reductase-like NAD-dependent aldehyde dehydrogenase